MKLYLIAALCLAGCAGKPPCEDDVAALVMAHSFVKDTLRSPSTAEFPMITSDGVSVSPSFTTSGQCAFRVSTYADAQNAFGGTVRQNFVVTLAPDTESKSWSLIEMTPL